MRTLIINSSNVVPNTNNSVYKYNFPAGNVEFVKGQKLALGSVQMYYSTFNITSAQGNNQFSYIWVDGREITITIPDGFYQVSTLNDFLHFVMVQQGHYLLDTAGNYYYFITFVINSATYAIDVSTFPISLATYPVSTYTIGTYTSAIITTSSPATPVAWSRPTNQITPMVRILANNFRNICGFQAGYYPQGQTGYASTPPSTALAQAYIANTSFSITSIVGTALTTTGSPSLVAGMVIQGTGITNGTTIVSGSANSWVVSVSQSVGAITGYFYSSASTTGTLASCSISGTALTTPSTTALLAGMVISGAGVTAGTYIVSGSGTSWVVSVSQIVASFTLTYYSMSATQSPSYTTIQTFSSTSVPQVSPLSSYVLTCNLLNNNFAIPNSLLYSFAPDAVFGSQFTVAPNQYSFIDIQPGQYNSFQVSFLDQNNIPTTLQDNNLVILLIIADDQEASDITMKGGVSR
jgi:hypothetical protein